jgi:photosystem II stability/assembly factor-like uncharacterized protein
VEYGVAFATEDGGQSWRAVNSRQHTISTRIVFKDTMNGWQLSRGRVQDRMRAFRVQMEYRESADFLIGGYTSTIQATSDGGHSWAISRQIRDDLFDIKVTSEGAMFVVGARGRIMTSRNGGVDWARTQAHAESDIYALGISPSGVVLAVGDEGLVLFTDSDGRQWCRLEHPFEQACFHGVHFTSDLRGVLVSPTGLYQFGID